MVTSEQFNFHVQFCQGFQNPLLNLFKKKNLRGGMWPPKHIVGSPLNSLPRSKEVNMYDNPQGCQVF